MAVNAQGTVVALHPTSGTQLWTYQLNVNRTIYTIYKLFLLHNGTVPTLIVPVETLYGHLWLYAISLTTNNITLDWCNGRHGVALLHGRPCPVRVH